MVEISKAIFSTHQDKSLCDHILDECRMGHFNYWREHYHKLTITDLIYLNTGIHKYYPNQAHYNGSQISCILERLIRETKNPLRVIELGCHQGNLANDMLGIFKDPRTLDLWVGYDINYYAIDETVCKDDRYIALKMLDWFHSKETMLIIADPRSTIFIASNTMEHFALDQFIATIAYIKSKEIKNIILDQPFADSWRGRQNTHILRSSVEDVCGILSRQGFARWYKFDGEKSTVLAFRRV